MDTDTVRLHEMSGRSIIARAESTKIGALSDILFSPEDGTIYYLMVETAGGLGGLMGRQNAVAGEAILALGKDAIMIRDQASIVQQADQIDRAGLVSAGDLRGLAVITDGGARVGEVKDFLIDTYGRRVLGYVVGGARGGPFGLGADPRAGEGERIVPVQRDVTIGSELVTIPSTVLRGDRTGTVEGETTGDEHSTGHVDDDRPGRRYIR
jgi:sporulation protein YlmC with PRC-barrel domain